MVFGMIAKLACNVCCFLYPAYASYKALSVSPESSPEAMAQVERWLMYWAVVGTWTAIEAVMGWVFTWLPFYSVIKTLVFLYLSSPQSEGSSYIYRTQLAPFFHDHERDIDMFLASLKSRMSKTLSGGAGWAWEKAKTQLAVILPQQPNAGQGVQYPAAGIQQPPTLQDPASGAAQQLYGYFTRYAGQYVPVALSAFGSMTSLPGSRNVSASGAPSASTSQAQETMAMPIPRPHTSSDPNQSLRSRTYVHATQAQPPSPSGHNQDSPYPSFPPDQANYSSQSGYAGVGAGGGGWKSHPLPNPPTFPTPPAYASPSAVSSSRSGYQAVPQGPRGQASREHLSAHSSEESLNTRSSNSGSVGRSSVSGGSSGRYGEMSYEHVQRDEAWDSNAQGGHSGPFTPQPLGGSGQGTPGSGIGIGRPGGTPEKRRSSSWFGWGASTPTQSNPHQGRPKAE